MSASKVQPKETLTATGQAPGVDDYYISYTDEPHATRRKLILAKYPQIKELYGYDPNTKWVVSVMVLSMLAVSYYLRDASWGVLVLVAYCFGGTIAHSLHLAIHEISHNLLFEKVVHNKLFGLFANIPIPVATSITFQKYHLEHHQFQGMQKLDMDIPSRIEGYFFTSAPRKLVWMAMQPLFYAIRPLVLNPKQPGMWEFINWATAISSDLLIAYFWGSKSLAFLALSAVLGSGLHPVAGHFIAEHYVFNKGQETYSYYGPLNVLCFNVGYHNEHHDFPRIPGSRLPLVRQIAPEFYENLYQHNSWVWVIWKYVTDPTITPFSRVMRPAKQLLSDKDD